MRRMALSLGREVFAVEDEVARMIASILIAHVNRAKAERTLLKPPATCGQRIVSILLVE